MIENNVNKNDTDKAIKSLFKKSGVSKRIKYGKNIKIAPTYDYSEARMRYKPKKIKLLFINESPPFNKGGGIDFFYFHEFNLNNDLLFKALAKAIYPSFYELIEKEIKFIEMSNDLNTLSKMCDMKIDNSYCYNKKNEFETIIKEFNFDKDEYKKILSGEYNSFKVLNYFKRKILEQFQKDGIFVIDVCSSPMNKIENTKKKEGNEGEIKKYARDYKTLPLKEKTLAVNRASQTFISSFGKLKIDRDITKIILLNQSVFRVFNKSLKKMGFDVLNKTWLPYPKLRNKQNEAFIEKLKKILEENNFIN